MDLTGPDFSRAAYWTEFDEHGERLVMPMRRNWKVVGTGFLALVLFAFQHRIGLGWPTSPIDWLWPLSLVGLTLLLVVNVLTSRLAREVLRIEGGALVHSWALFGLRREKRYPLRDIRALSAEREVDPPKDERLVSPFKDFGKAGWVTFECQGQTVGLGAALDQAHAQQVVLWIARRAPRSVLEP